MKKGLKKERFLFWLKQFGIEMFFIAMSVLLFLVVIYVK